MIRLGSAGENSPKHVSSLLPFLRLTMIPELPHCPPHSFLGNGAPLPFKNRLYPPVPSCFYKEDAANRAAKLILTFLLFGQPFLVAARTALFSYSCAALLLLPAAFFLSAFICLYHSRRFLFYLHRLDLEKPASIEGYFSAASLAAMRLSPHGN